MYPAHLCKVKFTILEQIGDRHTKTANGSTHRRAVETKGKRETWSAIQRELRRESVLDGLRGQTDFGLLLWQSVSILIKSVGKTINTTTNERRGILFFQRLSAPRNTFGSPARHLPGSSP